MARKKDGRPSNDSIITHRNFTGVDSRKYVVEDHDTFRQQLDKMGLAIRDMPGDGNCLFRALGDQLDGHARNHLKYRNETTQYMMRNRVDFEPFVEDDVPFERYLHQLRQPGTYAGNDAIVAFSRARRLNVIIHQMNTPPWVIQGTEDEEGRQLHISYRYGDHYDSIRRIGDTKPIPANIKLKSMFVSDGTKAAAKKASIAAAAAMVTNNDDVTNDEANVVLLHDDEYSSMIECITAATECTDRQLITDMLVSSNYHVERTIDALMTIIYNQQILDDDDDDVGAKQQQKQPQTQQSGARPKQPSPPVTSKGDRKLEKRERATNRHKDKLTGNDVILNNKFPAKHRMDEETIVHDVNSLQI